MVQKERWEEIRRMFFEQRVTVSQIARGFDLDRKTVRRCLRQSQWQPYSRAAKSDTLLAAHEQFVRERAAQVNYSARIVYQELKFKHGYCGSYDTVKRAVAPLREVASAGELCLRRFETQPGEQSQIDWGQALVYLASGAVVLHLFVLTLGFSRRGFYYACANERMSQFLEAHERAFEHFGGHTREHLYDRAAYGVLCRRDGQAHLESDLPGLCAILGLLCARVPSLPCPDQGQGRIGGEVRQAQLPARA